MRTSVVVAVVVCLPIAAFAQTPPPAPKITTGQTATAAREAMANTPAAKPDGGGAASALEQAQLTLAGIRGVCVLVENDGKLFAACDNTTPAAKVRGGPSYLPQISTEWEAFARRLVDADRVANNKRRPVTVLNNGEVVVEASSAGVVKLKK